MSRIADRLRIARTGVRAARAFDTHAQTGAAGAIDRADEIITKGERALAIAEHVHRELKSGRPQQRFLGMIANALVNPPRRR